MPGRKISFGFVFCVAIGVLLIAFGLFGTFGATTEADRAEPDMAQVQVWLATGLNLILAGLAFILAGVGCQLMAVGGASPQVTPGPGTGGWQQPPGGGQYPAPQQAAMPGPPPMQQQPQPQQPPTQQPPQQ